MRQFIVEICAAPLGDRPIIDMNLVSDTEHLGADAAALLGLRRNLRLRVTMLEDNTDDAFEAAYAEQRAGMPQILRGLRATLDRPFVAQLRPGKGDPRGRKGGLQRADLIARALGGEVREVPLGLEVYLPGEATPEVQLYYASSGLN
jgi:hypothetical protein